MAYTPNFPSLYNCAAAGFCAGVGARRNLSLEANESTPVVPSDFSAIVTAAFVFAQEVDALLATVLTGTALTNADKIITNAEPPATYTLSTAAATNVNGGESLPDAMIWISKAAWEGRSFPILEPATGLPFTTTDYQPVANQVCAEFANWATYVSVA